MDIAKKIQSSMGLTTLIVVKNSVGLKTELKGHVNEIGEAGRVMTQEQCSLDQVGVINVTPNPITSLLALNHFIHLRHIKKSYSIYNH